tara:strand:+ start:37 stop:684 length:648 start_codon:yes stop_codon:yes gene_type:complete
MASKFPQQPKRFELFDNDLDSKFTTLFSDAKALAVDTEAMGLQHGRDRLCLIQICDAEDNIACIKINLGQKTAPNLKLLMENPLIEKVFHFARFDVAALNCALDIRVSPIFCTKIASKIARTYSPRHGLKEIINELLGIELDKQSQSSDWGTLEDLTEQQLIYAANDVRYLLSAKTKLEHMLYREKRFEIAKKCFKCIPVIAELDILRFHQVFEH